MDIFFASYKKDLEESVLREKHRQIYNCDESGFRSDQCRHTVLAARGVKYMYRQATGTKEHITVLACFNATGEDVPSFIVYSKCFLDGHYTCASTGSTEGVFWDFCQHWFH
jgi:hypothetical protein